MKKQTIWMPTGMTASEINVCVENDKIIVSYEEEPVEPKYKCGDVVVFCDGAMSTVVAWDGWCVIYHFSDCGYLTAKKEYINDGDFRLKEDVVRLATEEEVFRYHKALRDAGYEWDAEKMQFVEYVWKPNYKEMYYYILADSSLLTRVSCAEWYGRNCDKMRYELGNCFNTKEAALSAAVQLKEVLKNAPKE